MNCNREGTWGAWPVSITINESGDNKLTAACVRFAVVQEAVGQEWRDLDDQMDLTGYWYFEKRDGSLNGKTVQQLREAFPEWGGLDPFELEDEKFLQAPVQVTTRKDTYQGAEQIKAGWLSKWDKKPTFGGGMASADDGTKRSIRNRLQAKLRAFGGGRQVGAPGKPAGGPTRKEKEEVSRGAAENAEKREEKREEVSRGASAADGGAEGAEKREEKKEATPAAPKRSMVPPRPGKASEEPKASTSTEDECWTAFVERSNPSLSDDQVRDGWLAMLQRVCPGKDELTAEEWGLVMEEVVPPWTGKGEEEKE